ncbi:MAG: tetratricopeptide repeat protein [Myxococcota bacterium]|nr:tetratricopeptide repeat protein [Myxococcota bacterium]
MLTRPSRPLFFSRVLAFLIVLGLSATATADPKINQAKSSFRQGQRHFQAQKFTKALAAFETAYSHVALAGFLFNIGQCHMELENYEKAASYFKLYIEKKPDAASRPIAERRLKEALRYLGEDYTIKPPPPPSRPSPRKAPRKTRPSPPPIPKPVPEPDLAPSPKEAPKPAPTLQPTPTPAAGRTQESRPSEGLAKDITEPLPAPPVPLTEQGWFRWAAGSAIVVTVGVGAFLLTTSRKDPVMLLPSGTLGTVDQR